jgi:hypothetical protein
MANKLRSKIPKFLKKLEALQAAVDDTADMMLEAAQEIAPSPWHPGPWARGALVNAMYIQRAASSNDHKYTFDEAVAAAMASASIMHASDPQRYPMLKENEIDHERRIFYTLPGMGYAVLTNPMYYAGLIVFGGVSDSGNVIAPQPFMLPVAQAAMPGLVKRIKAILK